jgi:tripartite-type tricarboxylate transporter receptor subunit TctC
MVLRLFVSLLAAAVALAHGPAARAYPDKPVRLVIGYPAGDTTDLAARVVAAALADFFNQKFIVEDHAGSNGTLAMTRVGKADHDGHTLLVAPSTLAAVPGLYPGFAYQPLRNFVPIARFAYVHNVLVVGGNASRATTLRAFLDIVRSSPSKIIFASAGSGSPSHLAAELMKLRLGPLNTLHVPYKGSAPAITDLMGARVDALFATLPYAYGPVKSGRVRAIAVASAARAAQLPDVPTFGEAGLRVVEAGVWQAMLAPLGTPYDTIVRLGLGLSAAQAATRQRLYAMGAEPLADSPDRFQVFLRSEIEKWTAVVKAAGIVEH